MYYRGPKPQDWSVRSTVTNHSRCYYQGPDIQDSTIYLMLEGPLADELVSAVFSGDALNGECVSSNITEYRRYTNPDRYLPLITGKCDVIGRGKIEVDFKLTLTNSSIVSGYFRQLNYQHKD